MEPANVSPYEPVLPLPLCNPRAALEATVTLGVALPSAALFSRISCPALTATAPPNVFAVARYTLPPTPPVPLSVMPVVAGDRAAAGDQIIDAAVGRTGVGERDRAGRDGAGERDGGQIVRTAGIRHLAVERAVVGERDRIAVGVERGGGSGRGPVLRRWCPNYTGCSPPRSRSAGAMITKSNCEPVVTSVAMSPLAKVDAVGEAEIGRRDARHRGRRCS